MSQNSNSLLKPTSWHNLVLFSLGFWFSCSLLVDFLVMPGLFVSGMMSQPDFGAAGYSLFWLFNRVELLCGALMITGLLAVRWQRQASEVLISGIRSRWALELSMVLLAIAVSYTYFLTPAMSSLSISLDAFQPEVTVPDGMNALHGAYWLLEMVKLVVSAWLLRLCYQDWRTSGTEVLPG